MKVTVCQLSNDRRALEGAWHPPTEHIQAKGRELVLLPEMPFHPWLASRRDVVPGEWEQAVRAHDSWVPRLHELGAPAVLATRPVIDGGERFNEAVAWGAETGIVRVPHRKQYLPEEEGFWEASWYSPGTPGTESVTAQGASIGFAICTEMWFLHRARKYSKKGIQLLACPRATLAPSTDKWIAGGRVAAVVSGAFCLSSNFSGSGPCGEWGGAGWIVEPEEGEVLAVTSATSPFATAEIDLAVADTAKSTYPRYVVDR